MGGEWRAEVPDMGDIPTDESSRGDKVKGCFSLSRFLKTTSELTCRL